MNYSADMQWILNGVLAIITLGIALDLQIKDFVDVARQPLSIVLGLIAQFLLLPAATWLAIVLLQIDASWALGMLLVSSCPGGGTSNFISQLAGGNVALSVSMTAVSSSIATFMMPVNLLFWANAYPLTAGLLDDFNLAPLQFAITLFLILGLPLGLGLWWRARHKSIALRLIPLLRWFSILALISFIGVGMISNWSYFTNNFDNIFWLVAGHNGMALLLGFFVALAFRRPRRDQKTIAIEVGIQNSGLGLAVIYSFFDGHPSMALIAAWWGVWHLIAGFGASQFLRRYYR